MQSFIQLLLLFTYYSLVATANGRETFNPSVNGVSFFADTFHCPEYAPLAVGAVHYSIEAILGALYIVLDKSSAQSTHRYTWNDVTTKLNYILR